MMDYDIDYVGHEYKIDTSIQRRLYVFAHQILPDVYINIQTYKDKNVALKSIDKMLETLLHKDHIIVSKALEIYIKLMTVRIILKKVIGEKIRFDFVKQIA